MSLKLKDDLDILKMYLHTENEAARLRHSKLLMVDEICMVNEKNTKIALKVKGQMPSTSNHFGHSLWDIYPPSYIDFRPVVFEI